MGAKNYKNSLNVKWNSCPKGMGHSTSYPNKTLQPLGTIWVGEWCKHLKLKWKLIGRGNLTPRFRRCVVFLRLTGDEDICSCRQLVSGVERVKTLLRNLRTTPSFSVSLYPDKTTRVMFKYYGVDGETNKDKEKEVRRQKEGEKHKRKKWNLENKKWLKD